MDLENYLMNILKKEIKNKKKIFIIIFLILLISSNSYAKNFITCKGFKEEGVEDGKYYEAPFYETIKLDIIETQDNAYFIITDKNKNKKKLLITDINNQIYTFGDVSGENFMFGNMNTKNQVLKITILDQVYRDLMFTFYYRCKKT